MLHSRVRLGPPMGLGLEFTSGEGGIDVVRDFKRRLGDGWASVHEVPVGCMGSRRSQIGVRHHPALRAGCQNDGWPDSERLRAGGSKRPEQLGRAYSIISIS